MPQFIYFDLGNVLLTFSHQRAARQMAEVAGISSEQAWQVVFGTDLEHRYERGEISSQQFYDEFCRRSGTSPDSEALQRAGADIFELNVPMAPVVGALKTVGFRLGILSNTNQAHWEFVRGGRYGLLRDAFEICVLSYEVGAMKPEPQIYEVAIERAAVPPAEIFFMDDRPENVAGALQQGLDAVQFTSARQLVADLRRRGVEFNY